MIPKSKEQCAVQGALTAEELAMFRTAIKDLRIDRAFRLTYGRREMTCAEKEELKQILIEEMKLLMDRGFLPIAAYAASRFELTEEETNPLKSEVIDRLPAVASTLQPKIVKRVASAFYISSDELARITGN